ncbi:S-adenosyl-L-methionine-dependent methyltransferase [Lyophyllum atratum]|nr:S-adenosyl-L-methionine-dependent methyltransferase [Lyophyllum atratum]
MLFPFAAFRARNRALPALRSLASVKRQLPQPWGIRRYVGEATAPPRTRLEKHILDSIKATGPISFSTYMQVCLSDPTYGYYMNPENHVFGPHGDFITSPEISQVFGELVAVWFLTQWRLAGMPSAVRLVELGPGRGTLMSDIVRVISLITSGMKGTQIKEIHLVETSEAMRKVQEEKIGSFAEKAGCRLHWHNDVDTIEPSNTFSMVVAHEFFDALPFYLLQKAEKNTWHEVMVASALDPIKDPRPHSEPEPTNETSLALADPELVYPRFRRVLSPEATPASIGASRLSPRYADLPVGSFLEVSPWSHYKARKLAALVGTSIMSAESGETMPPTGGGCGLIIDYGDATAFGDSFRVSDSPPLNAFQGHKIVDVFHQPGESDVTTNVDFALLKEAMGDAVRTLGPISQAEFLSKMGIEVRVAELVRKAQNEERRDAILNAANRLVDPAGMGKEYKVMGFTSIHGVDPLQEMYPFATEVNS